MKNEKKGGEDWMNDNESRRFITEVVASGLILRPDRRILFVKRKGRPYLTYPTGHLDPTQDKDLEEALDREMKEELFRKERRSRASIQIMGIVYDFVRIYQTEDGEPKNIPIYVCEVDEENANAISYEEAGEKGFVWLDLETAMQMPLDETKAESLKIPEGLNLPLDELAEKGTEAFSTRYQFFLLGQKEIEEGENGTKQKILALKLFEKFKLIFKKSTS